MNSKEDERKKATLAHSMCFWQLTILDALRSSMVQLRCIILQRMSAKRVQRKAKGTHHVILESRQVLGVNLLYFSDQRAIMRMQQEVKCPPGSVCTRHGHA
jgi:hypothetical protein